MNYDIAVKVLNNSELGALENGVLQDILLAVTSEMNEMKQNQSIIMEQLNGKDREVEVCLCEGSCKCN